MHLTGKQKRFLRSLGHNLDAIVRVGKGGVADGLVNAVDQALLQHELIKVRVLDESPIDIAEASAALASACAAEVVQKLGHTFLLYRAHPENPEIVLPAGRSDATDGDAED